MKVLVKIEQYGKTLGYQPFEVNWVFTSFERLKKCAIDKCHNGESYLEMFEKNSALKTKGLFSVKLHTRTIEHEFSNGKREVNEMSDLNCIHLLEGQTAYLLNPETGKTIDIIRYDDL